MFAIIPSNWKFDLKGLAEVWRRSDDSLENHEMVRSNLLKGERLFLIGTEGVSDSDRYIVAVDHIALFGSSPLTGPNRDVLGPRFPSLMGMYIAPDGEWEKGVVGRVPDWKLATPAELRLFGSGTLVSEGIDEAEIAGHGGAKVVLLVRSHGWESINTEPPPVRELASAALNLYNLKFTRGGEEQ
ncbi:hypothetical protein DRQ25_13940 [Candidatus Fermentibacteria bacterium]|nr:MAG: hypothetical protein DRQ25_13940 [Candidatus Fermentibacteria bacterium]